MIKSSASFLYKRGKRTFSLGLSGIASNSNSYSHSATLTQLLLLRNKAPRENCVITTLIIITMHPVACLVLALAAAAAAAPASDASAVANGLETRQTCLFECLCDSPNDVPVGSTSTCCASIGGSFDNGVCSSRPLRCCVCSPRY